MLVTLSLPYKMQYFPCCIEKGIKQGREEGRKEWIRQLVSTLRDLSISDEIILQKIQEKYLLSKENAKEYL